MEVNGRFQMSNNLHGVKAIKIWWNLIGSRGLFQILPELDKQRPVIATMN